MVFHVILYRFSIFFIHFVACKVSIRRNRPLKNYLFCLFVSIATLKNQKAKRNRKFDYKSHLFSMFHSRIVSVLHIITIVSNVGNPNFHNSIWVCYKCFVNFHVMCMYFIDISVLIKRSFLLQISLNSIVIRIIW